MKKKQDRPAYGIPQNPPVRVTGYGVPGNNPDKRRPEKPTDLPQEIKEWLDQITSTNSGKDQVQ